MPCCTSAPQILSQTMSFLPCLGDPGVPVTFPASARNRLNSAGPDLLSHGWITSVTLPTSSADNSAICTDGKAQVGVIFRGPSIEIIVIKTNEQLIGWNFGGGAGSADSGKRGGGKRRNSPDLKIGRQNEVRRMTFGNHFPK